MQDKIIVVDKLTKKYAGDVTAVDGISFRVDRGEFFGFLGPNGAGKTTTIRMLANLTKKTSGSAKIDGVEVSDNPQEIYKKIGFAMQEVGLDETASAREMMMLHGKLYHLSNDEIEKRMKELLKLVELEKVADKYASTFSGGMRRRLDLALALIHRPKVLFLDEPTVGLDPHARNLVWEYLRDLNKKGMTIFLTTHFMDEAEQLCTCLAIIDNGKIVENGSPKELIAKHKAKTLEEVFLATTGHSFGESEINTNATDPYSRLRR